MARKKGRDVNGWLIVDKPAGVGSTDVVGKVRWALDAKKAGHAGTLDPDATGVLAVALGEATKTVPMMMEAQKVYRFTVNWGVSTDSADREGDIIARSDVRPTPDQVRAALPAFVSGLRQGWAFAWRGLMAAEIIAVGGPMGVGLGTLLYEGRAASDLAVVLCAVLTILAVGVLVELAAFGPVERRMLRRRGLLEGSTR
mgnify:CR=1 FL=1